MGKRQSALNNLIIKCHKILCPQSLNNMYYTTNKTNNPLMMLTYFNLQSYRTLQRCLVSLVLLISLCMSSYAQQKGIDGNLQILSPYPVYISDFSSLTTDRLKLMVRSNEFMNSGTTDYRLRIVLEKGNSIIAQSDAASNLSGVSNFKLLPNVPYNFTAAELAPYFSLVNLNGINGTNYIEPLTEGVYRLSFLVYGAKSPTGPWTLMSDAISQQFWVVQNDPPLLNAPAKRSVIENDAAAMINFQWIPRAIQTAARHEYEFTLVEIDALSTSDPYILFNNAIKNTIPIKRTVTVPALAISAAELGLGNQKTYAWQVRVRSFGSDNRDVINYKNDGYSDIYTFSYQRSCDKPTNLTLEIKGDDLVNAKWNLNPKHLYYRVAYRKYSTSETFKWIELDLDRNVNSSAVSQLEPNTKYEVKVGGVCGENYVNYCDPVRVKTPLKDALCGVFDKPVLSNTAPIVSLSVGNIITAGDFPILVTKISGGNGIFSGEGTVASPWLGFIPFKVNFNNITVNTDKRLIAGYIETVYDPTWGNVASIDRLFNSNFVLDVTVDGVIGSITIVSTNGSSTNGSTNNNSNATNSDEEKQIVIKDANGNVLQTLKLGSNYTVTDKDGNQYSISKDGKITKLAPKVGEPIKSSNSGKAGLNNDQPIASDVPVILFEKHLNNKYGFDAKRLKSTTGYEELPCTTCNNANYFVNWKSVATGDSDIVKAAILVNPKNTLPDSVYFRTDEGRAVNYKYQGNNVWHLYIIGELNAKQGSIYAFTRVNRNGTLKEEICGKLNYVAYDVIKHKVQFISVNGYGATLSKSELQTEVNKVFKAGLVEYDILNIQQWQTTAYDGKDMNLDHGALFSYSAEQKALINEYKKSFPKAENTLYLFMVNKAVDKDNRLVYGHTPLAKSYGFLFTNGGTIDKRTVIHEVGHGSPCGLEHTFEKSGGAASGSTDNVMDYGNGMELDYEQWKEIRSTWSKIRLIQDEEEGQLAAVQDVSQLKRFINSDKKTYTFITPAGQPITLPSDIKSVGFSMGDNWQIDKKNINSFIPFGTLVYFTTNNGVLYTAKGGNYFIGYQSALDATKFYEETLTLQLNPKQGIIGIPCLRNGFIDFAVGEVNLGTISPIPTSNRGAGTQSKWDFLVNKIETLIKSQENVEFIHVNFNPDLKDIPEVNKFLFENQEYAQFGNINALYVFAHANQIAQYREIVAKDVCDIYTERAYPRNKFLNFARPIDNTEVAIDYYSEREKWLKASVIDWANLGISRYWEINNTLDTLLKLETETDVKRIMEILYKSKDNTCIWVKIPFLGRINAIERIASSDYVNGEIAGLITGGNKEFYLVQLFKTTPKRDKFLMLDYIFDKKNYSLISTLWAKVNGSNGDKIFNMLSRWLIDERRPKPDLCGPVYEDGNANRRETNCFTVLRIRDKLFDVKLQFTLSGSSTSNSITFETTSKVLQPDKTFKTITYYHTGKPDDFITFYMREEVDYTDPNSGKMLGQEDKIIAVPLIWAYWLQYRYNKDKDLKELAFMAQMAFTVATVASGTVIINPTITNLLVTTNFVTGIIQYNEEYIIREFGDDGRAFLDFNSKVAMASGIGELTALGIVKLSNSTLTISYDAIKTSIRNFGDDLAKLKNIRNGLNLLASKVGGLVKGVSDDALKLANIAAEVKNAAFEMGIRTTLKSLANDFVLKIQNATYALVVYNGLELRMFKGSLVNNVLEISEANWAVGRTTGKVIGYLDKVKYCKNGSCNNSGILKLILEDGKVVLKEIACFTSGTEVQTKEAPKPIQYIEEGDIVKTYDEISKTVTFQKVVHTFKKTTDKLVRVVIGKDTLWATPEHPFFIVDNLADGSRLGNWMSAESLKSDFKVLLSNGLYAEVKSVNVLDTTATVYNFEVENTHNYYVGTEGVLVHNDCIALDKKLIELSYFDLADDIEKLCINVEKTVEKDLRLQRFASDFEANADALKIFNTERLFDEWLLYRTKEVTQLQGIAKWRVGKTVVKEDLLYDDLRLAIGTKTVVRTYIDYTGRLLFVTNQATREAVAIEPTGVPNEYRVNSKVKSEEETQYCEICTRITLKKVCDDMTNVFLKANQTVDPLHAAGMAAICGSSLTQEEIGVLMVELLKTAWTATAVSDFLKDLTVVGPNSPNAYLSANINSVNVNTLAAWKLVYSAKTTNFKENYRRDIALLNQVKDMLSTANATMLTTLGGQAGLKEILQKHYTAPCKTCENNAGNSHLRNMDGYLKDLQFFVSTYVSTTNTNQATSVLGGKGIRNSGVWQVRGTAFMLDAIHKPVSITNFTKFEDNLAVASPYTQGCNPDAREEKKIIEFKSWSPEDVVTEEEEESVSKKSPTKNMFKTLATFDYKPNTYNSYTQFRCYMSNIDKMEDLVYYFDARNGKVNEGYVRNVFKQLLYVETVNANNETVGNLTAQGVEIFNIIWGQSVLRENLFPDINFSQTDNIIKPIGLKQFKDKIASLSDSFYKFIKVK
jgi:Pretoxin HINT domain/Fibronectin type III domain